MGKIKALLELPEYIREGLVLGKYERIGGVIRHAKGTEKAGSIVAFLRELEGRPALLEPMSPIPSLLSAFSSILSLGVSFFYGRSIIRNQTNMLYNQEIMMQQLDYLTALGHNILTELEELNAKIELYKKIELKASVENALKHLSMAYEGYKKGDKNAREDLSKASQEVGRVTGQLVEIIKLEQLPRGFDKLKEYDDKSQLGQHIRPLNHALESAVMFVRAAVLEFHVMFELNRDETARNVLGGHIKFMKNDVIHTVVNYLFNELVKHERVIAVLIDPYWREHEITEKDFLAVYGQYNSGADCTTYYELLLDSFAKFNTDGEAIKSRKIFNDHGEDSKEEIIMFYRLMKELIASVDLMEGYLEESNYFIEKEGLSRPEEIAAYLTEAVEVDDSVMQILESEEVAGNEPTEDGEETKSEETSLRLMYLVPEEKRPPVDVPRVPEEK